MKSACTELRRALVACAALLVALSAAPRASAITQDEIITLSKLGIAPDEIVKTIEKDRTVFNLTVADILALKKANVDEKVLKFMLGTPKRFAAEAKAADEPAAPEPEVKEETPEERATREERLRQEALRMLEEKQRQEEAQRRAYAEGVLARGRALADDGKFVESIQAFHKFMEQGGFPPDSSEAYLARFGIANALVKAGLYQAAAKELVEVLLAGPDRPFFQAAFNQLRELRRKVNYSPPDLEELTKFFVGKFSTTFQDEYNYVLGEFYYDYNNWSKALSYLEQVGAGGADYGKAQYLKGLVEVRNQLFRSAVESFQRAIVATEENESEPEVTNLAYLALARIAYAVGDYDAAIYYYRKIPPASARRATAFYESAWAYFLKGDASRALGVFQTLHSPYFEHQFYPELWIIEATTYMNICQYELAEKALERFKLDVAPLALPLKRFLLQTVRPEDYYKAIVSVVSGRIAYELPRVFAAPVLSDVEFYNLYRTIKQIEAEQEVIGDNIDRLGPFGHDIADKLRALRADRIREIGIKIQRILKETESSLAEYAMKLTEIEIDLQDLKLEAEERKLRALGGEEEETGPVSSGDAVAIVGGESLRWRFEGEYWKEEIGTYRSFIADKCAR